MEKNIIKILKEKDEKKSGESMLFLQSCILRTGTAQDGNVQFKKRYFTEMINELARHRCYYKSIMQRERKIKCSLNPPEATNEG